MKIGIIGQGYVGSAIKSFLLEESNHHVKSYDIKDYPDADEGYRKIVKHSEMVYLCLPTPMDAEGRCFTGIVESALALLNHHAEKCNKFLTVMIKSTLVPGTTDRIQESYDHLILVVNPEFLTERTAKKDFKYGCGHLVGIPRGEKSPLCEMLRDYHDGLWPHGYLVITTPAEAEMTKYISNCYLAIKVATANHIYDVCPKVGIEDYNNFIQSAIRADPRIGGQHWQVPGPDGDRGFGGSCFPKDLNGMIRLLKDNDLPADIFEATKDYNEYIRPAKDWEKLKGRAVIDKE